MVVDKETEKPIAGAVLTVYRSDGQTRTENNWPFDQDRIVGQKNGEIIVYHVREGFEFGGTSWRLFWIIPMGASSPRLVCKISADGYETRDVGIWSLFDEGKPRDIDDPMIETVIKGEETLLYPYSYRVELRRQ